MVSPVLKSFTTPVIDRFCADKLNTWVITNNAASKTFLMRNGFLNVFFVCLLPLHPEGT